VPGLSAFDAVDGSSTDIVMCQGLIATQERRMSAFG